MKVDIVNNLDNPRQLEILYRANEALFKREFNLVFRDFYENPIAQAWNERLNFEKAEIPRAKDGELFFVLSASILAGIIAKLPEFSFLKADYYYPRNIAFIVLPLLIAYFAWLRSVRPKTIIIASVAVLASVWYINSLPDYPESDTLKLACIHLPLFLWSVLGFVFVGGNLKSHPDRLSFLRYNGDLAVMTTIILIAGMVLTAVTLGLFGLIQMNIHEFCLKYIVIWGISASPIIGTYLIQSNPHLVNNVSPVIAKIFTPLVLVTLVIYLLTVIGSGKDPYNDRDFLLVFNFLLVGVMAIILFSVAETSNNAETQSGVLLLFGLAIITVIVNCVALSAILFRISEWGITPNRIAVLGGNVLILTNLLMVSYRLFRTLKDGCKMEEVGKSITRFMPAYFAWTAVVTFLFPIIFGVK